MPERPFPVEHISAGAPEEPADASKESKEAEPIRRTFEYRDARGGLLGIAEIELDGHEVGVEYLTAKGGNPGKGRRLRSFVIKGEKDGAPTVTDMIALANRHGVEIISASEHLKNYAYYPDPGRKSALVPPLETPLDVGVFLHELGHADQYHEDRFAEITPLYGRAKQLTGGNKVSYEALMDLLQSVVDAVPDAMELLDHDALKQLERLERNRLVALERKRSLERALEEQDRHRNGELQALLIDASPGLRNLEAIAARCNEVAAREAHETPPLLASPDVARLVETLTDIGIRFAEEFHDDGLDARTPKPGDRRFEAYYDAPAALLSEKAVTTGAQALDVLTQTVTETDVRETDLLYDKEAGELITRTTVRGPGKPRAVALRLAVSEDDFDRYARLREGADREIESLEQTVDAATKDLLDADHAQQLLIGSLNVADIAALPTRMMERDATRRAFQWLRAVRRDAGVDLLAPHLVQPEALVGGRTAIDDGGCVGSVEDGFSAGQEKSVEATIVEDLKRALATYGADKMRLHPPDDQEGPGIIPVAGRPRPRKPETP